MKYTAILTDRKGFTKRINLAKFMPIIRIRNVGNIEIASITLECGIAGLESEISFIEFFFIHKTKELKTKTYLYYEEK